MIRLLALLSLCATTAFAAVPPEFATALKNFRPDAPHGWSFTQTTTDGHESLVEHCDAAKAEFERWALVEKNGRAPTSGETQEYLEMRSRRSRGGTAPKLTDQFDLSKVETLSDTAARTVYRCGLITGEKGDLTAQFLRVTVIVEKPSLTIASIELASVSEFSPTFGVRIAEMKTTLTYSPPVADTPSLPQKVATHVRGRAFWLKSLDADMTVTFSDYENAFRKK